MDETHQRAGLRNAANDGDLSAVTHLLEQGANVDAAPARITLNVGDEVVLKGLVAQQMNGMEGCIIELDVGGRIKVRLAGLKGHKLIKSENLQLVPQNACPTCTFVNGAAALHCAMCDTVLLRNTSLAVEVACPTCYYQNSAGSTVCNMCGTRVEFCVDGVPIDGTTPLYLASQQGHLDIVRHLVEHGACIDAAHPNGSTPLFVASRHGHLDVVCHLVEHGASIDAAQRRDQFSGATPLSIASFFGHLDVVSHLAEHGANLNVRVNGVPPLYLASQQGHLDIVRQLLEHGASIGAALQNGSTPLHVASANGKLDVVRHLVERGASMDAAKQDSTTPLYMASQQGHLGVVRHLVEQRASIDLKVEPWGATPLYIASQQGQLGIVRHLAEHGASVNAAQHNGSTPLFIAIQQGHLDVARHLLDQRANPEGSGQMEDRRLTPLFMAHQRCDRDLVLAIRTRMAALRVEWAARRQWARVLCCSASFEGMPIVVPRVQWSRPLQQFFNRFPGLTKQIGGIVLRYFDNSEGGLDHSDNI